MAAYAVHYNQLKYPSPNRSNNNKKTRITQKSLPFGKWRFREKEVRRMGQKQKMIKQKEQQDYAEEQERRLERWDQTDRPEIPAGPRLNKRVLWQAAASNRWCYMYACIRAIVDLSKSSFTGQTYKFDQEIP